MLNRTTAGAPQRERHRGSATAGAPQRERHSGSATAGAPQRERHSGSATAGVPQRERHSGSATAGAPPLDTMLQSQCFFNISAFRPHQAPTYTHHTCHLRSCASIFHFPTTFFIIFLEMSSPPIQEAQFRILTQSIFNEKSHFFDVEKAQIEPVLVMVFGLITLSFAPFPFYPPHASQAGPQKTLQICAYLLQVASLGDFKDICDDFVTTF